MTDLDENLDDFRSMGILALKNLVDENLLMERAMKAMQSRGLSKAMAEMELGVAVIECLLERAEGKPDRWPFVLRALREGKTTRELFPYCNLVATVFTKPFPFRDIDPELEAAVKEHVNRIDTMVEHMKTQLGEAINP